MCLSVTYNILICSVYDVSSDNHENEQEELWNKEEWNENMDKELMEYIKSMDEENEMMKHEHVYEHKNEGYENNDENDENDMMKYEYEHEEDGNHKEAHNMMINVQKKV